MSWHIFSNATSQQTPQGKFTGASVNLRVTLKTLLTLLNSISLEYYENITDTLLYDPQNL